MIELWLEYNELETMWKEVAISLLKVPPRTFFGLTEKKKENFSHYSLLPLPHLKSELQKYEAGDRQLHSDVLYHRVTSSSNFMAFISVH
jgi:hypothetical protein